MNDDLTAALKAMLWDVPEVLRTEIIQRILADPFLSLKEDVSLRQRALESMRWHQLIRLVGRQHLLELLDDQTIKKLFPKQRQTFYFNARRLLSKYSLPAAGQGA